MLARRSKVDPLNECPLGDSWKVLEPDLDGKMSAALVKCFFAYRGTKHCQIGYISRISYFSSVFMPFYYSTHTLSGLVIRLGCHYNFFFLLFVL